MEDKSQVQIRLNLFVCIIIFIKMKTAFNVCRDFNRLNRKLNAALKYSVISRLLNMIQKIIKQILIVPLDPCNLPKEQFA